MHDESQQALVPDRRPLVEILSCPWLFTVGIPLMDCRIRQTATASPAEPGSSADARLFSTSWMSPPVATQAVLIPVAMIANRSTSRLLPVPCCGALTEVSGAVGKVDLATAVNNPAIATASDCPGRSSGSKNGKSLSSSVSVSL